MKKSIRIKLTRPFERTCLFMLSKDYTTELLGLKDVIVKNMEETEDFIKVSIELERKPHTCPCCGKQTQQIHDYRQQTIKDLPIRKKTLFLQLRKRRYHCPTAANISRRKIHF